MNKVERNIKLIIILLIFVIIGIGYASLSKNIQINGTSQIIDATWDIHFVTNSIHVSNGSVLIDTNSGQQNATITNATQVNYAVKLALPGDFYEFTVEVENTGSIDAMIDSISSKLGNTEITTGTLPSYINYSISYDNDIPILAKQILRSNTSETIKVKIEYKEDITENDLPETTNVLNLNLQINYVQANSTAIEVNSQPISFTTDSWDTISRAIQNNNTSAYTVGSTKEVDLGTLGIHTLRVANNSTPEVCSTPGYSQTACGFVLEFVTIVTEGKMNQTATSSGGWRETEMVSYLNNEFYNLLPEELQNIIIPTFPIVSGSGSGQTSYNITEEDTTKNKIYLLSTGETGGDSGFDNKKNPNTDTRMLDYYSANNNNTSRIKRNLEGTIKTWWLRSANKSIGSYFYFIDTDGDDEAQSANKIRGISPAFRIG